MRRPSFRDDRRRDEPPPREPYDVEWRGGGRRSTRWGDEAYAGDYPIPGTHEPLEPEHYRAFTPPPGYGYGTPSGASHGHLPHRSPDGPPFGSSFAVGPGTWRSEGRFSGRGP